MSRRRSQSDQLFDDLFDVLRHVPWWVGPPLVLLVWVLFRFALPAVVGATGSTQAESATVAGHEFLGTIAVAISPFAAGAVALVWIAALCRKWVDAHRLERQDGLSSIRLLPWAEFEQLLAEAFRRQGYSVRDTGPGADGGVDLILARDGKQTLVQAKQWKTWKVGVKVVRELYGIQASRQADRSMVVTSGTYTREAKAFAAECGVQLVDGEQLRRLIASVQRSSPVRAPAPGFEPQPEPVATAPACPACGSSMVKRTARRGNNAGTEFWGCSRFPACRGTRDMPG